MSGIRVIKYNTSAIRENQRGYIIDYIGYYCIIGKTVAQTRMECMYLSNTTL